jgi:amino acid transporter
MTSGFRRHLGFWDSLALVVGTIVGSGIFLTPAFAAGHLPSPPWIPLVWAAGGLIAAAGAVTYAELAVMMPRAGGSYVYLREAYGPALGLLYGWTLFAVLQSGSIAAIAVGFAHYFGKIVPFFSMESFLWETPVLGWRPSWGQICAVAAVLSLTLLHAAGLKPGRLAQNAVTLCKVLAAGAVAALAFAVAEGDAAGTFSGGGAPGEESGFSWGGLGLALVAVLWSYSGWWNLGFVAEEMKNPRRHLLPAMAGGVVLVMVLYILMNGAYLHALGFEGLRNSQAVAEETLRRALGVEAGALTAAVIGLSMLGALNGLVMMSPRAYFAMARDGGFAGLAARLHPSRGTPAAFLWVQALWSAALALTGGYEALFTYVMFAGFLFTLLGSLALLILRRRLGGTAPALAAPWAYPWVPVMFALVSLALALNTLWRSPLESLLGLAVMAAGWLALRHGFS